MELKEPPDRLFLFVAILLLVTIIFICIIISTDRQEKIEQRINDSFIIIQGNSVKAVTPPHFLKPQVLAMLLDEIIKRESGGNPKACNKQYGCKAGMGLTQLIPSTVKYCEEKLKKKIDPFNPDDNLECAMWLLENEGLKHWEPYSGPYENELYRDFK